MSRRGADPGRRRPTVVVVGAGFGGLATAKALRSAPVRTVVVDRNNYQLFAPLLYQVATALLDPSDVAHPVRALLRGVHNAEFRQGTVEEIDLDRRVVVTDQGGVAYDYLVVAAGAETNFFGNASARARSIGMKELPDALALRSEVLARFERATWTEDHAERGRLLSFLVVGGGSTGIETAGAIAELVHHVLRKDYSCIDASDVSIVLVEGSDRLLAPYHPDLRAKALARLEAMGVDVQFGSIVESIDEDGVHLAGGRTLPPALVVWTAGVRGAQVADSLGVERAEQGRVPVVPTLQLSGRPEVFVVGDLAAVETGSGPVPMLAPGAIQEGRLAARNIVHLEEGQEPEPFRYRDKGIMSTIGRNAAVVQVGRFRLSGLLGWVTWMVLHLAFITSVRSQVSILWNWTWNYIHRDRPARLILPPVPATTHARRLTAGAEPESPAPVTRRPRARRTA